MNRDRLRLLAFVVVIGSFAYYYVTSPKIEVDDAVRGHVERCLDHLIEKNYEAIYDTYLRKHALSIDEFSSRVDGFEQLFGAPQSYRRSRSYVGGTAYFIEYRLVLNDGKSQTCTFSFPAQDGGVIRPEDLLSMNASAEFGEKMFEIDFESGDVIACSTEQGCFGDGSSEQQ